jgi:hypothetical protein
MGNLELVPADSLKAFDNFATELCVAVSYCGIHIIQLLEPIWSVVIV